MPEARKFSITLQEDMQSLLSNGPLTLFIPVEQQDVLTADAIQGLVVKGHYSSHELAWAHMSTLSHISRPILWGKPREEHHQLSTIKVAGDYYLVHGENDDRVHLKLKTDLIVEPNLVVHFIMSGVFTEDACLLPLFACPPRICGAKQLTCGFKCADAETDKQRCGACGNKCEFGCIEGKCGLAAHVIDGCSGSVSSKITVWSSRAGAYLGICPEPVFPSGATNGGAMCTSAGCGSWVSTSAMNNPVDGPTFLPTVELSSLCSNSDGIESCPFELGECSGAVTVQCNPP
eukprot:TRINITY_DN67893_c3_g1_i1.p1 TRINITY_DN67893_c3_g1~~TRINITY_DN67893_c3_g1_i1.p1  ORF type:complete len:335 (+),score=32.95 TRINITY_DN67893_c3_g1_i1:139-1005(+)